MNGTVAGRRHKETASRVFRQQLYINPVQDLTPLFLSPDAIDINMFNKKIMSLNYISESR